MPHEPPENLIELLASLGLATRQQVEGVAGRVRRLAGELPLFESVWVDALSQAKVLTPFQAAQINAGRGSRLAIGPYLLARGLASNGLGEWLVARQGNRCVRLLRAPCGDESPAVLLEQFQRLIQDLHDLNYSGLCAPIEAGIEGRDCWVACEQIEGLCAADWLAHNGRLPPLAVLEIARQMLAALAGLESRGRLHGDLGARQLILANSGKVVLPLPGIRAILRPAEGYTRLDLQPEGYDYLAPERIAAGTPPNTASEMYACGCLWWHLLCGRPPLSGGDALGKLRSAQQARIADPRRFAPDAPPSLVEAIVACTQLDPHNRPKSFHELSAELGESDKAGRGLLARCLIPPTVRPTTRRGRRQVAPSGGGAWPLAVAAVVLVAAGLAWLGRSTPAPLAEIRGPLQSATAASAVNPALATETHPPATAGPPTASADLILSPGTVSLSELKPRPGQTVRGAAGQRTRAIVPPDGLLIDAEDVRWENIDFVLSPSTGPTSATRLAVLLSLRVRQARFHGCSFQGLAGDPTVALDWSGPEHAAELALPSGRIELSECLFRQLECGVRLRTAGAMRVELNNSLHLGPGAWLAMDDALRADEACLIVLNHCTLRGGQAVLRVPLTPNSGEISVRAQDCVFAPATAGGLVALFGSQPHAVSLARLRVSGQGSVLVRDASLAIWQPDYGPPRALADEEIEAAGLVRSPLRFAGDAANSPAASRVVHWQAPLSSPDPPGILDRAVQ